MRRLHDNPRGSAESGTGAGEHREPGGKAYTGCHHRHGSAPGLPYRECPGGERGHRHTAGRRPAVHGSIARRRGPWRTARNEHNGGQRGGGAQEGCPARGARRARRSRSRARSRPCPVRRRPRSRRPPRPIRSSGTPTRSPASTSSGCATSSAAWCPTRPRGSRSSSAATSSVCTPTRCRASPSA